MRHFSINLGLVFYAFKESRITKCIILHTRTFKCKVNRDLSTDV